MHAILEGIEGTLNRRLDELTSRNATNVFDIVYTEDQIEDGFETVVQRSSSSANQYL